MTLAAHLDLEAAFVGAAVAGLTRRNGAQRDDVAAAVRAVDPEWLVDQRHRETFAAARRLLDGGTPVDSVAVSAELAGAGHDWGPDHVGQLLEQDWEAAAAPTYARQLRDRHDAAMAREREEAERREFARFLADANRALGEGTPPAAVRAHLRERFAEAADSSREGGGAAFPLLADLVERPELLAPPAEIVPRLAWRGRAVGLVAPEKSGKSTLASAAAAELSRGGWWLGDRVGRGRAVIVAPDEYVGDTVRRLHERGADGSRVRVLTLRPTDLMAALVATLSSWPADLVVVDSLAEWARVTVGAAPDDGDSSGWGAVVRPLVAVSRDHNCGILLLHHPRRSDGEYRGSGEIAAALDATLTMRVGRPDEDPTLRRIAGRARWPIEAYSVRLDGDQYVLGGGGPISLDARVLTDAAQHPGTSRAKSFERLGGRKQSHVAAVARLVDAGTLVDRAGSLFLAEAVEEDIL